MNTIYTPEQIDRQNFWAEVYFTRVDYKAVRLTEIYRQHKKAEKKKNKDIILLTALEEEIKQRLKDRRERTAA